MTDGDYRQCWNCGEEQFRILVDSSKAECTNCGELEIPAALYSPDSNGREYYKQGAKE